MDKGSETPTRNFRVEKHRMIASTYSDAVLTIIAREYSPLPHAAKILAQHAKTSYRTAENWLSGMCAPNGEKLVNLMAECEALAQEVNRLVAERRAEKGN
jgi:hypothetical protein